MRKMDDREGEVMCSCVPCRNLGRNVRGEVRQSEAVLSAELLAR